MASFDYGIAPWLLVLAASGLFTSHKCATVSQPRYMLAWVGWGGVGWGVNSVSAEVARRVVMHLEVTHTDAT